MISQESGNMVMPVGPMYGNGGCGSIGNDWSKPLLVF